MLKALFRCLRKLLSRIKARSIQQRRTENGAGIDIEDALAEQIEYQRRSGRVLSSTASIAAALRQRPRDDIPIFSTHLCNNEWREPSNTGVRAAVQSPITGRNTQSGKRSKSVVTAKSPVVSKRVPSASNASSSGSSFVKIPEPVVEDAEPEHETETKEKEKAVERPSEINPRRSSIFDMRSEWI